MEVLSSAKTMMSTAQTEATAAMVVLPPAIMINFQFKLADGEPANLDKAGQKWREAAEKLQQTSADLQEAVAGVPAGTWTGADRQAYEQQVQQVCQQLEIAATYYMAVGIALTAYAYALFTYAVFAVGMGTFLAGLAVAAAAALASVVGAPAYSGMLATAGTCLTITWAATGILAGAAQMAAAVFQGGAALTALLEYQHGNKQALSDFAHAEAVGSAAAVANLTQNAANAGIAFATRGPKSTFPVDEIDLDADRDSDNTWQLGAGASGTTAGGTEWSGGANAQYGDHGWQGVGVEGSVTTSTGHTVGGSAGYKDEDGFGQGKGGTVTGEATYGYENATTGSGYEATVGGEYNTDSGDWKAEGSGSYTTAGGQTYGANAGYNSDGTISGSATYGSENATTGSGYEATVGGEYNTNSGDWKAEGSGSYTTPGGSTVDVNGGYGSDGTVSGGGGYQDGATGAGATSSGHYDPQTGEWVSG